MKNKLGMILLACLGLALTGCFEKPPTEAEMSRTTDAGKTVSVRPPVKVPKGQMGVMPPPGPAPVLNDLKKPGTK